MIVVVDSSSIIGLARVGKINILKEMFGKILISQDVFKEVVITGKGRPGSEEIEGATWIEKKRINDVRAVKRIVVQERLSYGEAATIVLSKELKADLTILDEKKARGIAQVAGINVMGTAGMLEEASKRGIIDELREVLDELRKDGFRLSDNKSHKQSFRT